MNVQRITALGLAIALTSAAQPPAVREPPGAQPREWTLREDLRLGDSTGFADDLRLVGSAVAGRDGSIGVFLRNGYVVVFDRSGRVRHRVATLDEAARRAEMREQAESSMARARAGLPRTTLASRGVPAMGRVGDTLWVSGEWTRKITFIDDRGRVARRLTYSAAVEGYASGTPLALLSDGSLLRTFTSDDEVARPLPAVLPPRPPEQYRMPVIPGPPPAVEDEPPARGFLVRAAPNGRVVQGLEIFPAARMRVTFRNPFGQVSNVPYPFRDDPLMAATPDGSRIVFVERYAATKPGAASYAIAWFDVATGRRVSHRHEYIPVPVDAASIDNILEPLLDSARASPRTGFLGAFSSRAAARSALRAALNPPPYYTPFTEVVAGADGAVWLRHRASDRWDAHTRDGRVPGRVTLPPGARLVHADGEVLWVAMPQPGGPRGADVLVRYRIVRPE